MHVQLIYQQLIKMKSDKPESVSEFLTSKKLLSSKMKNQNKSKVNRTNTDLIPVTPSASDRSVPLASSKRIRQFHKNHSENINDTYSQQLQNLKQANTLTSQMKNNHELQEKERSKQHRNIIIPKIKSKDSSNQSRVINSRQYDFIHQSSKGQKSRHERVIPPQIRDEKVLTQLYSSYASKKYENNQILQDKNYVSVSNGGRNKNPEISQLQIRQLLKNLSTIKINLQRQIKQLVNLLDNTQQFLKFMDNEYREIKENILNFTSNILDAAYKQYKENLPNFDKYENVQDRGVSKLNDLNDLIESIKKSNESISQPLRQSEIYQLVQNYQFCVKQIEEAKQQCYSMWPRITEDRIKDYQKALYEIGKF